MQNFLIFLAAWMVSGIILNLIFKRSIQEALPIKDNYLKGYTNGIANLKMYYYVTGEMPDTQWLQEMRYKDLSTREKFEAVTNPSLE